MVLLPLPAQRAAPHCTDTASKRELQSTLFLGFLKTTSFIQDMIKEKQRLMFLTV